MEISRAIGGSILAQPDKQETPEKNKKQKTDAGEQKATQSEKDESFRYIVRIANTDIDGNKNMMMGIQSIKGVGPRVAAIVARRTNIDPHVKIGELSEDQTEAIAQVVLDYPDYAPMWAINRQNDYETGEDLHLFGVDLDIVMNDDVNRLKMIRSYRGIRHEKGRKVRGQRTRSNGRTGLTMGVSRTRAQPSGKK
ncbi:MAG: 30S ribosomal protein S13 [Euryarchaeota archaeon]|nr:30S ribosomal protein S13 [Euryarchaeota archaeon]